MVNFLKLQATWANVGNDTSPHPAAELLQQLLPSTGGFNMPTNKANYNLKPENVRELGIRRQGRFDSRLTFDVAFYNATTTNQEPL